MPSSTSSLHTISPHPARPSTQTPLLSLGRSPTNASTNALSAFVFVFVCERSRLCPHLPCPRRRRALSVSCVLTHPDHDADDAMRPSPVRLQTRMRTQLFVFAFVFVCEWSWSPVTTGIDPLRVRVRIRAVIPRGTPVIQPSTIAPCTPTFIVRHDLGSGYGVTPLAPQCTPAFSVSMIWDRVMPLARSTPAFIVTSRDRVTKLPHSHLYC